MQENYLAKWLNNELSEEELAAFKQSDEYASYVEILKASNEMRAPDFDVEKALEDLKKKKIQDNTKVVRLTPLQKMIRVAAAVVVIFGVAFFYMNSLGETVTTQYAERTEVTLPDNSQVILNADSEISYSEKQWHNQRNIDLEGEAFFKVAKGERFTVKTEDGMVAVLGTQFNVENREGFFEVTCFEGLVSVTYQDQEKKLPAGSSFLVINGKIMPTDAPNSTVPSWINNESTFKSIPLSYVFKELERQYGVKVETENIDLQQLFTGTFSNTNINLALQSISTPSQIKFKLEENKVLFYAENAP